MDTLNYYCYVSRYKVNQLYEQISDFSVEEASRKSSTNKEVKGNASGSLLHIIKAGLSVGASDGMDYEEKGVVTALQKLKKVLAHLYENEAIMDLNDRIDKKPNKEVNTSWFLYKGKFMAESLYYGASDNTRFSKEYLINPGLKENQYKEIGPNQGSLVSGMCILYSKCEDFTIQLACSLKYFSDMGGSWHESSKEWSVGPHSGNYHFFSGSVDTFLESLIFVNGIKDKIVMGTPLFLIHSRDPKNGVYI